MITELEVQAAMEMFGIDTGGMDLSNIDPGDLDKDVLGELALRLSSSTGIAVPLEDLTEFDILVLNSGSKHLGTISQWMQVDLVGAVAARGMKGSGVALPKEDLDRIADFMELHPSTVRNLWTTYKNWPQQERRPGVDFSKHKRLNNKPYRFEMIEQVESESWTVKRLAYEIKVRDGDIKIVDPDTWTASDDEEDERDNLPDGVLDVKRDWSIDFRDEVESGLILRVEVSAGEIRFFTESGEFSLRPSGSAIKINYYKFGGTV